MVSIEVQDEFNCEVRLNSRLTFTEAAASDQVTLRRVAAHSTVAGFTAIAALEAPMVRVTFVTVLTDYVRLTRTDAHHIVTLGRSTFTAGACDVIGRLGLPVECDDKVSLRSQFPIQKTKRVLKKLTCFTVLQADRIAKVVRCTDLAVVSVGVVRTEQTTSRGRVTGARYA